LAEAVLQTLVDSDFSCDNLEEMEVTLKSKSNDPLEVTIEPGTMFLSQSAGVQNMVVTEKKIIYLDSSDDDLDSFVDFVSDIIDVACACMELDMPQGTDEFTISTTPTEEVLGKLLNLPGFGDETFRIKQFAIWTITDNPPRDEYVGIGYYGFGTGPNDEEMSTIKALFESAGITTSKYQALGLVGPTPTAAP